MIFHLIIYLIIDYLTNLTNMQSILEFPKAEVHLHLLGSFDCDSIHDIAKRNSIMPSISKLEYRSIQENFSCLNDLLALIRLGSSVIQSESDMYDLTLSALSRLSSSNIVYAEPSLNIGLLMNPLVSPDKIIKSITAASSQVETLYNIKIN